MNKVNSNEIIPYIATQIVIDCDTNKAQLDSVYIYYLACNIVSGEFNLSKESKKDKFKKISRYIKFDESYLNKLIKLINIKGELPSFSRLI